MALLRLIHWNEREALDRSDRLRAMGHRVQEAGAQSLTVRAFAEDPPDAVIIDLSRLPSHGRAIGVVLRQSPRTRHIPIVFVGGEAEKIAGVRRLLPDATFATWVRLASAIRGALARPPIVPHVPPTGPSSYPHSPLAKKLGIKPESTVAILGGPRGLERALGTLPESTRLVKRRVRADLVVWFVRSRREFDRDLRATTALAHGPLWIAYPKQSARMKTDLRQDHVRESGLAIGLIDSKVCAIDETWTGLRFSRKKQGARRRLA